MGRVEAHGVSQCLSGFHAKEKWRDGLGLQECMAV
jgi:hypothetical protein